MPDIEQTLPPGFPNYGIGVAPAENLGVAVTSTALLPANRKRVGLVIFNTGPQDLFLAFDQDAEAGKGICLQKNGQQAIFGAHILSRGPLNAIVGSGTGSVGWQEFER